MRLLIVKGVREQLFPKRVTLLLKFRLVAGGLLQVLFKEGVTGANWSQAMRDTEKYSKIALLDELAADSRRIIGSYLHERTFPVGQALMLQGDVSDGCYFIDAGSARVELAAPGRETSIELGRVEAGGMVGEMSLIGMKTRSASVYAETDVAALWLSNEAFAKLQDTEPATALVLSKLVAREMAARMQSTNARLLSYIPSEATASEAEDIIQRALAGQTSFAGPETAAGAARVPTDMEIIDTFIDAGIDTVCLVADSIFASMDQYLMDLARAGKVNRWVVPSERSIPAVAVGRWLATGDLTLMSMQNSGFTNAMDYLRTVMLVHKIPGVLISSWRGFDANLDDSEPHILVGDVTDADNRITLGDDHVFGRRDGVGLLDDLNAAIKDAQDGNISCLRISPPGFTKACALRRAEDATVAFHQPGDYAAIATRKGRPFAAVQAEPLISRDEALCRIHDMMKEKDPFYIVGNGFNPRAMQALRLTDQTFENAGGMGSTLAIAWGAAKSDPGRIFVAIEGDQNATMNEMEKVVFADYPENLYWFILNNGTGESVGPSLSLPLAPWFYDLAYVINTSNLEPGGFKHPRVNASGLKFDSAEAKSLAAEIGNLPAQAHLARKLLEAHRQRRA